MPNTPAIALAGATAIAAGTHATEDDLAVARALFEAVGRVVTIKDPLNNVTTTTYDVAGQVTAVTDALGHTTSFGYDAVGRRTTVTDAPICSTCRGPRPVPGSMA